MPHTTKNIYCIKQQFGYFKKGDLPELNHTVKQEQIDGVQFFLQTWSLAF